MFPFMPAFIMHSKELKISGSARSETQKVFSLHDVKIADTAVTVNL